MNQPESQAEQHLLEMIRSGDQQGWSQFVSRYQGRMTAFASQQVRASDTEDVVQETFVSFLHSLSNYRGETNLESWLFQLLRRRIVDYYRSQGDKRKLMACAVDVGAYESDLQSVLEPADPGNTPSVYAGNLEQQAVMESALSSALRLIVDQLRANEKLRDLMIIEGLFYAGLKNRRLAEMLSVSEGGIATVRHRILGRLRERIQSEASIDRECSIPDDLLHDIWDRDRPSCPKRTTLGKHLMGILDEDWSQYVDFHVETLKCQFCLANKQDLALPTQSESDRHRQAVQRIFDSTVGFISIA